MSEKPLVSVVIPCYNHAQFVQETIQSVIDQDYENIELIIIDDGSQDNSVAAIQEMVPACEERFVRFSFRHRENRGLCATLNEMLSWCQGHYFSACASDDLIYPYKISLQVDYLERRKDLVGVFGGIDLLEVNGNKRTIVKGKSEYFFKDVFLHEFHLPAPTQLIRLANIKKVGGFNENLIIEDWSMWLSLTKDGCGLGYIKKPLAVYRKHANNLSGEVDKMYMGRIQILEEYKKSPFYLEGLSRVIVLYLSEKRDGSFIDKIGLIKKAISFSGKLLLKPFFYKNVIKSFL